MSLSLLKDNKPVIVIGIAIGIGISLWLYVLMKLSSGE